MNISAWGWLKNQLGGKQTLADQVPCFWQTDVHSHLIPGVDDGVATIEQALECIRKLSDWGIQKVITTPHVSQRFFANDAATLIDGRDQLQEQVDREAIPVQIEVAAEYMLDEAFLNKLDGETLLSFGPERYLLVETGMIAQPMNLTEVLFNIQTAGYIPVLAHPERYSYYYDNVTQLERLRDLGCLFQLNWMSLTGRYGSRARTQARLLLKNEWVDLIGSDLHRPADIPALQHLFTSSSYELLRQQPLRNTTL